MRQSKPRSAALNAWLLAATVSICSLTPHESFAQNSGRAPQIKLEQIFKPMASPGDVTWSPDGKYLLASDGLRSRVIAWDLKSKQLLYSIGQTAVAHRPIVFANQDELLTPTFSPRAASNRNSISVVGVKSGQIISEIAGPLTSPTYPELNLAQLINVSSNLDLFASTIQNGHQALLNFYRLSDRSLLSSHNIGGSQLPFFSARSIAFKPRSDSLAVFGGNGEIQFWKPKQTEPFAKLRAFFEIGGPIAFSPNGDLMVASYSSGVASSIHEADAIRMWRTSDWKLVGSASPARGEDLSSWSIDYDPKGRYVASLGRDGKARLWDGRSLKLITEINDGGTGGVALAFSPDGKRLAIARNFDVRVLLLEDN